MEYWQPRLIGIRRVLRKSMEEEIVFRLPKHKNEDVI
jgi:hypothetical protein